MYNTNMPDRAQLPSAGKLLKSTIIAGVSALAILFGAFLPAEYGIDPTGVGRTLGLTQMGEIKQQLAKDAAADASNILTDTAEAETLADIQQRLERIEQRLGTVQNTEKTEASPATAPAPEVPVVEAPVEALPAPEAAAVAPESEITPAEDNTDVAVAAPEPETPEVKSDVVEIVLKPGQGAEIKLEMARDAEALFSWTIDGGVVNYDMHGDPPNPPKDFYHGYGKGKESAGESGTLKAAFDGNHGWFWRNRGNVPVKMRLETKGGYVKLKRVV